MSGRSFLVVSLTYQAKFKPSKPRVLTPKARHSSSAETSASMRAPPIPREALTFFGPGPQISRKKKGEKNNYGAPNKLRTSGLKGGLAFGRRTVSGKGPKFGGNLDSPTKVPSWNRWPSKKRFRSVGNTAQSAGFCLHDMSMGHPPGPTRPEAQPDNAEEDAHSSDADEDIVAMALALLKWVWAKIKPGDRRF